MGLQQFAVIGQRRNRREQLQRRHRHRLADAHRRHVGRLHGFRAEQQPFLFAWQLDPGRFAEAERFRVSQHPLAAHPLRHFGETGIDRILDDVGKRHLAITAAVPVLDHPAADVDRAGVVEHLFCGNHFFMHRSRRHQRFESGPRLIDAGNRPVAPGLFLITEEYVGIVGRSAGHRQNLAGLRIHHDHRRRLGLGPGQRVVERLLHRELDRAVDRQMDRMAGLGFGKSKDRLENRRAFAIGVEDLFVSLPLDRGVHPHLDAGQSFVIGTDEPEYMGGQLVVGVHAATLFEKIQPTDLFFSDEFGDPVVLRRFQRPFQPDEGAFDF